MPNQSHKQKSLKWVNTSEQLKPKNSSWSEDGLTKGTSDSFDDYLDNQFKDEVSYRLYNDTQTNSVILSDLKNGVTFTLPGESKTRGYIIAFKLLTKSN